MNRSFRPRLAAAALVGAVVFGVGIAIGAWRGEADPRAALAGLLTAGMLTVALLALIGARRRAGAGPSPRRTARGRRAARPDGSVDGDVTVIPLGDGQAAVIWDEPVAARPVPAPPAGGAAGDSAGTADAIWNAVEAAVRAAEAPPAARPPTPPSPGGRLRSPWWRRSPPAAGGEPTDSH